MASRTQSDGSSDVKSSGGRDRAEQEEVIAVLEVKKARVLGSGANMFKKILPGLELERKTVARKPSRFDWPKLPELGPKETRPGSHFSPREIVMGQP